MYYDLGTTIGIILFVRVSFHEPFVMEMPLAIVALPLLSWSNLIFQATGFYF